MAEKIDKQNEQNRVTLAIAYIAVYLTLILGLYKIITPNSDFLLNQIFFGVFILHGLAIVFFFFLYLLFVALELDFHKKKEIMLDQEISTKKIQKIKRFSYNMGVKCIFLSFTFPLYYSFYFLQRYFSVLWSFITFFVLFLVTSILLYLIIKD